MEIVLLFQITLPPLFFPLQKGTHTKTKKTQTQTNWDNGKEILIFTLFSFPYPNFYKIINSFGAL